MKKKLICIVSICIFLAALYMLQKKPLPIPEYPLSAATLSQSLPKLDVSCTVQDDEQVREMFQNRSLLSLNSTENGNFVAGISSGQKNGKRILFISFAQFYSDNTVSFEECERAITFATCLYGEFKNEHQVYDRFIHAYDKVNTVRNQYEVSGPTPMREGDSFWKSDINGITCQISFEQPKLDEPQEYLSVIIFTDDWDTFYPDETLVNTSP